MVRKKKKYKRVRNIKYLYFKDIKNLKKNLNHKKFYAVIHCATHYKKNHSYNDIKKMIEANIYLGNIILENHKQLKFQKFLNFTTVWENFMAKKNNPANLYSAYKLSFSNIINYYKKKLVKVKFYNLYLSETFGDNDKRKKLFNELRINYLKDKITTINSKNLKLNVINVKDVLSGVNILLSRNVKTGNYSIKNKNYFDKKPSNEEKIKITAALNQNIDSLTKKQSEKNQINIINNKSSINIHQRSKMRDRRKYKLQFFSYTKNKI